MMTDTVAWLVSTASAGPGGKPIRLVYKPAAHIVACNNTWWHEDIPMCVLQLGMLANPSTVHKAAPCLHLQAPVLRTGCRLRRHHRRCAIDQTVCRGGQHHCHLLSVLRRP